MSVVRYRVARFWHSLPHVCVPALAFGVLTFGCSALNPAAVEVLFPPEMAASFGNELTENAPGHVPIIFINNTRFSSTALEFLRSQGVDVADPDLRPRVRFRVVVGFMSGATSTFEFVDGSDVFQSVLTIEDDQGEIVTLTANPPPDLTASTLTNSVVLCDVAFVAPETIPTDSNSSIEMYVPVFLKEITIVETENVITRELSQTFVPRFDPLLVDTVDDSGTVVVTKNFGTRDVPGFPANVTCGSVVTFVLSGDLTLPFVVDENGNTVPGFLDTNAAIQEAIPGRFQLEVSVR